jgi:hypothetical protein
MLERTRLIGQLQLLQQNPASAGFLLSEATLQAERIIKFATISTFHCFLSKCHYTLKKSCLAGDINHYEAGVLQC